MVLTAEQHHPNIKIFVSAHKQATFPEGESILPVQVGAAQATTRFTNTLHDDEGENISVENPRYCELTAQYWLGRTQTPTITASAITAGISISPTPRIRKTITAKSSTRISTTTRSPNTVSTTMRSRAQWTAGTSSPRLLNDVRRIGGFSNLKQHWDADGHLRLKDLRHVYDILCARHPDYKVDADAVLGGRTAAFCNMFIMRKEIFFEYNEWLFPLLDESQPPLISAKWMCRPPVRWDIFRNDCSIFSSRTSSAPARIGRSSDCSASTSCIRSRLLRSSRLMASTRTWCRWCSPRTTTMCRCSPPPFIQC